MTKNNNAIKPFHGADKILNHVQVFFGRSVKELMVNYFESLDLHLLDLAETSETHTQQKCYFDSLKSIRVHKFNVLTSFLITLKQISKLFKKKDFDFFENKVTKAIKRNISDSIDQSDIEEKLFQNILIQKTDTLYQKELFAFKKRFSVLVAKPLEAHHIPICPYVLVSSFAKSIRLLHLDLDVKLVLFKQFEVLVLEKLSGAYKELNKYLHNNGIEPGLENLFRNKKTDDTPNQNPEDEVLQVALVKDLKENLENKIIDKESIFEVLTNLQIQVIKDLSNSESLDISPIDIKNTLLIQLQQSKFKSNCQIISQPDKDAINLITMMFQLVSGDRNIPNTIKKLLSKLHIPYIKAAMIDKSLLTNKLHPAQVILGLISKASVGWNQEKDKGHKFFNKAQKAVENIVARDGLDEPFFRNQLEEYQGFIQKQKNDFKQEQTRVKEKLKGRDRIVTAMKTIEALLNHKTYNVKVPVMIDKILMGSWKNLLVLLLVRHSDTSNEYLFKVNFIDDLISVIESEQYEVILKPRIEKLCGEYEEGLKLVAYSGEGLKNKIQEFKQCLFELHKFDNKQLAIEPLGTGKELATNRVKKVTQLLNNEDAKIESMAIEALPRVIEPKVDENALTDKEILDKVLLGSWFEFQRENKNAVKAQLSWISPKTGMHLFVNSRGLKVVDKMQDELVSGYKDKTIKFLKESLLV